MTTRHAAALTLLGWYLIVPSTEENRVREDLPFGKWENAGSYDTANECTKALSKMVQNSQSDTQAALRHCREAHPANPDKCGDDQSMTITYQHALDRARCIATDDPRLKASKVD